MAFRRLCAGFRVVWCSSGQRSAAVSTGSAATLGYTDTFLLNEVCCAPLRAVRLDPSVAYQWTIIALSLVGLISFFVICR